MKATDPDRLAALLDAVSGCLDDPRLSGGDLARRAHLSRFHFDRLAAAALGEPPGAFRRRLLLERAAYSLATTDRPVTTIAFDAGYGSLEAFSRAFYRAFGGPPSRHRLRRDTRFRIACDSGIHFHPPGGIRLPATEGDPMTVLNDMIEHHVWTVGELLAKAQPLTPKVLDETFPYNVDYGSDETSIRELLAQLVFSCERWTAAMEGGAAPDETENSVSALRERYAAAGARWSRSVTSALADGRSGETFIDALCEPPRTFTYGGAVTHVLTYGALHRSLAIGAMREAGVSELPSSDPIHWADRDKD